MKGQSADELGKKMVCVIKLGLMNFLTENTMKKKYFSAILTCLGQKSGLKSDLFKNK